MAAGPLALEQPVEVRSPALAIAEVAHPAVLVAAEDLIGAATVLVGFAPVVPLEIALTAYPDNRVAFVREGIVPVASRDNPAETVPVAFVQAASLDSQASDSRAASVQVACPAASCLAAFVGSQALAFRASVDNQETEVAAAALAFSVFHPPES